MDSSGFVQDTSASLAGAVIAAILFATITIYATTAIIRHRAWFLWTLVIASTLQFAGSVAHAYLEDHPNDHAAYMVNLATNSLTPAVLGCTAIAVLSRLLWLITSTDSRPLRILWIPSRFIAPGLFVLQSIVIFFLVFGLAEVSILHSPVPIKGPQDAADRLEHYNLGLVMLSVGNGFQIACAAFFAMFSFAASSSQSIWQSPAITALGRGLRTLNIAISIVMTLLFIRSFTKVAEYASILNGDYDFATSNAAYFLCDILPTLVSQLIFCWVFPGAYLPKKATQLIVRRPRKPGIHDIGGEIVIIPEKA